MGGVLSSRLIGNFERGCCQIIIHLFLGGFCREGVSSLHPSKKVLSSCVIKVFQIIIQLFLGVCEQGFFKWSDLRSSLFGPRCFGPRCSVSTNKVR